MSWRSGFGRVLIPILVSVAVLASTAEAHADDRETAGWLVFGAGVGVVGISVVGGGVGGALILSEDAPAQCRLFEGASCVTGLDSAPDDTRALRAGLAIGGASVMAILGGVIMWIGLDNVELGNGDGEVALSIRPDGFALRF